MNEKAREEEKAVERQSSRRSFLWKLWLGLGGVALLEYAGLFADFLWPRKPVDANEGGVIVAGALEMFEPGSVTAFPEGKFYLSRLQNGGFLALSRQCTHLGCTVPWDSQVERFVCPCHASEYDSRGDVLNPPAPRALDLFAVRIENGIVKVDVGQPLKRSSFEYGQLTQP